MTSFTRTQDERPQRFEVVRQLPGGVSETTVTDGAGVRALAEQAAASGVRLRIRPLAADDPVPD
ncbi:hypothetical protein ACQHIV_38075 [Kribbella sp. GL6]|uniref:hypothetical protein n=1 Tax=Kribbella sp. GL6 TaxID=3419765 RepID=UPI003CFDF111